MSVPIDCEIGYYCEGGNIFPTPCPTGTYGTGASYSSSSECTSCDATYYCDLVGQISTADICAPGFICTGGADRPGPYVTTYDSGTSTEGLCPIGQYCLGGDAAPTDCPATTYQPTVGQSSCEDCPPGSYCTGRDHRESCDPGYYCSAESSTPAPTTQEAEMGGICPQQHYCPSGTSQPFTCKDGYIQKRIGKDTCNRCPSGFTCKAGIQEQCPQFRVCMMDDSARYPYARFCPGGFYLDAKMTGIKADGECLSCPSTKFCQASVIVDKCAPGYVCIEESDSHTPNKDYVETASQNWNLQPKSFPCPIGYYCEEGAQQPIRCPEGTFTNETAAKQMSECTVCQPGKYCNYESRYPQGCPPGTYCPINSQYPSICPKGTYQPSKNMTGVDDCRPCLGGYYCFEE